MKRLIPLTILCLLLLGWLGRGVMQAQAQTPQPQVTAPVTVPTTRPSAETPAPETNDGVIEGKLQAGTKDATLDLSQPITVTLISFIGDQESPPVTSRVAPDGTFRFEKLLSGSNRDYAILVAYRNVDYFARETLRFSADKKKLTVTIPVYETTTRRDAIKVQRTHFILDFPVDKTLRVGELYIVDNSGDRAYVGEAAKPGDPPVTLRFSLPAGATHLDFQDVRMEESTTRTADGFTDSLPIPPGQRQVFFSYEIPFSPPNYKFVRKLDYGSANVNVLISDVGQQVNVTLLTQRETREGGSGLKFLNYIGTNMAAGQEITIDMTNLPQRVAQPGSETGSMASSRAAEASSTQDIVKWLGIGLALLVVGAAVGYPLLKGRRVSLPARRPLAQQRPPQRAPESGLEVELERRRRQLLTEVARLDDRFEMGDLDEASYQSQRAALKSQLIEVTRQIRAGMYMS